MVKVEGIYRRLEIIGQELLLSSEGLLKVLGNGNRERFFESVDEDTDFALFIHHVNWALKKSLKGYTFINLKPETLVKYANEIVRLLKGKVVIELREDLMSDKDIKRIKELRENYLFLLSIDDFGKKASNLDRIKELKPNFIKLDIKLFSSRKEMFMFVEFLKKYTPSARIIAEKVENERDFRDVMSCGIELWQGYYERKLYSRKHPSFS